MAVEYQNQNILITGCLQVNNNEMIVPTSQLMESPLNDPFMLEGGEDCILNQQDFCYYYYNNQLTPEEQALLAAVTTYDNNNNEIYLNDQINLTWSPGFELQDDNYIINGSYSYDDDIIENENFDSYNPFIGQSSPVYNDGSLNSGGMLLTQPLSEVTQNVIANQQFNQYNDWCDLSPYSDTQQQYIIDDNNNNNHNNHNHNNNHNNIISSKISEYNNNIIINNVNSNNNINNNNQNCYTAWTDFQLLEA